MTAMIEQTPLIRRAAVWLLVAFALILSTYRLASLSRTSTAIIARGEARFYSWAFREEDLALKYGALRDALGSTRRIELVVETRPYEEVWWQVMSLYYLPGYEVLRIASEPVQPAPSTQAIVTYDGETFAITRIR
jgi:hypothetical protein